jgi:hypothetical protein
MKKPASPSINRSAVLPDQPVQPVRWRVADPGPYLANLTASAGLFDETRRFLLSLGETGDSGKTRQAMVEGGLPQRSRRSRVNILKLILQRLASWQPPQWVWDDLIDFAGDSHKESLKSALLLHLARQDKLVYDFIQSVVWRKWETGDINLEAADLQKFLDANQSGHPEVGKWTNATRIRLSRTVLTTIRDYGLLEGRTNKRIVEPLVPPKVINHLAHLLREEGVAESEIAAHPDWRLWLMAEPRVKAALTLTLKQGSAGGTSY